MHVRLSLAVILCASTAARSACPLQETSKPLQGLGKQVPSKQLKPASAASELKALQAAYEASKKNYPQRFKDFQARFAALAHKYAGSEIGLEAELWLFSGCWWSRKDGSMNEKAAVIADRILAQYSQSPKLGSMLDKAYVLSSRQKIDYCRRIQELSKLPGPRAAALLALGKLYRRSKNPKERQLAEQQFQSILENYDELPYRSTSYGQMARAYLHPHKTQDLAVGKVAPEILGQGIDGKPLSLSQFRGKVVLLDFWGDW